MSHEPTANNGQLTRLRMAADPVPATAPEPRIVAFFCNWCTYTAADLAGTARMSYEPNTRIIRLMCSGRLDAQFVLKAFREGADGVLVGGCHPGDCHYKEGNYKAMRRVDLLKRVLRGFGIDERRLRLEWISASEGDRVQKIMDEMADTIRELGPLKLQFAPSSSDRRPRRVEVEQEVIA